MRDSQFITHNGEYVVATFDMIKGERGSPYHMHQWPHDLFIVRGVVRVEIGPISKVLTAPEQVICPSGVIHSFVCESEDAIVIATHRMSDIPQEQRP